MSLHDPFWTAFALTLGVLAIICGLLALVEWAGRVLVGRDPDEQPGDFNTRSGLDYGRFEQ